MQGLRIENPLCADCSDSRVLFVDLFHGVFLCTDCAAVHAELKVPIRSLDGEFTDEEIEHLQRVGGNQRVSTMLCSAEKPWFPTIQEFPFPAVRRFWVKAKYWNLTFTAVDASPGLHHSFDQFWFYLDEVTEELTQIQGPFTRSALIAGLGDSTIRGDAYVWHPALGQKWLPLEKLDKRVIEPGETDLEPVYRLYEQRRRMERQEPPLLKGLLDVQIRGKITRRWIMLVNTSLYIATLAQSLVVETAYSLQDLTLGLLLKDDRLFIHFATSSDEFHLFSSNSEEILEWFTALRCCKYMLEVLGDLEFPTHVMDMTEQHICNVKSSAGYMGKKVKEGILRKEGSNWKTVKTRWFVLRTQGLYYYKSPGDKACLGQMTLKSARLSFDSYKSPHHIAISVELKTLHLWAEDASERDSWAQAFQSVIDLIHEDSRSV